MWQEYAVGLPGFPKPARLFLPSERNSTYSKRLNFWRVVKRHVDAGVDWRVAVDKVYATYGYIHPTKILQKMKDDKKLPGGAHPNLVI